MIAHHVSIIVVQAGAERRVLSDDHADTREVLETVERTGRSALTETRRLLGMLRDESASRWRPNRGSTTCPCSSSSCARRAFPSSSTSTVSDASFRSGLTYPPTGSSRRR